MINFKPVTLRRSLSATPVIVPPPGPDVLYTGYTGVPGVFETLAVLGIAGTAAYVGIQTARAPGQTKSMKYAGWIGGIGSALLGLLYLGGKTGMNQVVSLPVVRVTPQ